MSMSNDAGSPSRRSARWSGLRAAASGSRAPTARPAATKIEVRDRPGGGAGAVSGIVRTWSWRSASHLEAAAWAGGLMCLCEDERPHADARPLEAFAERPHLRAGTRQAERVEQRQEVIVGRMREPGQVAERKEVDGR